MNGAISSGDMIIIALYMLGILGVGYYASRKVKSTEDYTIAGRGLSFTVLLGTLIGSVIGATATFGKAGKAYEAGIAVFVISVIGYGVGLIVFGFIAPTIRKMEIWTIPDALFMRYGKSLTYIAAFVMVLGVIAIFGGQLIAVGLVAVTILGDFGVTYQEAIIGAGIIMILYTMLGGLLAVAYTDVVQVVIMVVAIGIILPIIILSDLGGVAPAVVFMMPKSGSFWGGMGPFYLLSIVVLDITYCLIDPMLWQRTAAVKDVRSIRKGLWITSGVFAYWVFIAVFLGLAALHLFPDLGETAKGGDAAIPVMIATFMPPLLKGLCLAALMAVIMSTADTVLLIAGTTISRDIVKRMRPAMKDKGLLLWARGSIAVVGLFGVVFALYMKGIFDILLLAFAIFVSGIFVPTMAAIFWKKATKAGALISSIIASIAVILLYGMKMSGMLPGDVQPIFISIIISFVLMVVISLITYNPETATPRLKDLANS